MVCKIFLNFFFGVSVWSIRTVSLSVRTGMVQSLGRFIFWSPDRFEALSSGQVLSCVRTCAGIIVRTVTLYRLNARDQSAPFRGGARPDVSNTLSGRGPHSGYKKPRSPHSLHHTPLNLTFWLLVSFFCLFGCSLSSFADYLTLQVFLFNLFSSFFLECWFL